MLLHLLLVLLSASSLATSQTMDCSTVKVSAHEDVAEAIRCPSDARCQDLDLECLTCQCPANCRYGASAVAVCQVRPEVTCAGNRTQEKSFVCQYCFQAEKAEDYECQTSFECDSAAPPGNKRVFKTNCTVGSEVLCLGNRSFLKMEKCSWTGGYKWSTALVLSITLGGFGADRFYLGQWQEGIGKLFSFGGLGVWTLVDVVMVGIRYIGPSDGSLFI